MNSANNSADSNGTRTFFVNFNQDCTSLAVSCRSGYRLYSLGGLDTLDQIFSNGKEEAILVERLFSSSLMAVVGQACPRKLKVYHFKKGSEICNYSYTNTILSVRLNRQRLVVCLEESLYIHNIKDMKVLHTIRDTPPNPHGLCALSISNDHNYLAYPGSSTIGEVRIFDVLNLHARAMIAAHDSPLAALAFSPSGARLATASEKGTVIRVFSVIDAVKLFEFRRGVKRCVDINCLAFSYCSQFLACSSNTETVHIFKLDELKDSPRRSVDDSSWMGYLTNYLPTTVTEVFSQGRALMTAHLPVSGVKNVICITKIQQQLRLLVATQDGNLYVYNIDNTDVGGDLTLFKQHRLDEVLEDTHEIDAITNTQNERTGSAILGSYAGILKGNPPGQMSESEKFREMAVAAESPPEDGFPFGDKHEYPPLAHESD